MSPVSVSFSYLPGEHNIFLNFGNKFVLLPKLSYLCIEYLL